MSAIATAIVGGAVVTGYAQSKAAGKAADAQTKASDKGIEEQRRQFDAITELLRPYVEAGNSSIDAQGDLLGLNGPEAQAAALEGIKQGPEYQSLVQSGEEAILQNAAATGGLRGGNTQGALAQYRPQILSQLLSDRFNKLGSITNIGQASAAGQASAGQATGNNIAQLLQQQGSAQAGRALAQGQAIGNVAQSIGTAAILTQTPPPKAF